MWMADRWDMRLTAIAMIAALTAGPALAGEANVLQAKATKTGGSWRFDVTVQHGDTGWDHYADAWRVVGPDGTVYVIGVTNSFSNFLLGKSTNAQNSGMTPSFTTSTVNMGGEMVIFGEYNPQGLGGQAYIDVNPITNDLYALCAVDPPGSDPQDVHFTRSLDGGSTWSSPVRVRRPRPSRPPPGRWWTCRWCR